MRAFHPPIAAGADRPVADPGGDPLWRGQGSEQQRSRSMAGANFNRLLIAQLGPSALLMTDVSAEFKSRFGPRWTMSWSNRGPDVGLSS